MKKLLVFARLCVWLLITVPLGVRGQEFDSTLNYVVIGAFAHRDNAVNFTEGAKQQQFPAKFEMNPNRNLYYVYVLTTENHQLALAEAVRLRAETKYFDTWVYYGGMDALQSTAASARLNADIDPVTGTRIKSIPVTKDEPGNLLSEGTGSDEHDPLETIAGNHALRTEAEALHDTTDNTVSSAVPAPTPANVQRLQTEDIAGRRFYFHLFRADNGDTIAGEVDAIDFARSRKMATYPANKSVSVHVPSGESKHVSFICQVFGYRKQQKEFDPAAPAEELYLDDSGNIVVPFELVRLQKGDIAIMYNVLFFKDAAVMRPESRYEINKLLELLQENQSYKIRIHGHTNGNASGKIIQMYTPGNFYSLTGTKDGFGSAKRLSEERAKVIRDFLVHSGVAEDRMAVKAWGGKRPIYDPRSARAAENVRVEIEILSE